MWTPELEKQLAELNGLFTVTRDSIQFLKAAKERNVTPQELSVRIAKMQTRQTAIMDRICEAAKSIGGHVTRGKAENGIVYSWQIRVPSYHSDFAIVFDFGRPYEPEIYDLALSHQFWIIPKKKGGFYNNSVRRFYVYDRGYNDCESVPEFRKYIASANKFLAAEFMIAKQ